MSRLSAHLPTSDVRKMVDFYISLGFELLDEPAVREGLPIFARLGLDDCVLRIEHWNLQNWETLRKGFPITTLWIETESIEAVAERLRQQNISFDGPGREDYGTIEIELFDPEGFRLIFAQNG